MVSKEFQQINAQERTTVNTQVFNKTCVDALMPCVYMCVQGFPDFLGSMPAFIHGFVGKWVDRKLFAQYSMT